MHAHKFRDLIFLTSCTAVALIAQTQAIADTQGKTYNNVTQPTKVENQPASSSSTAIEEVLVTARRVEERQQDVPVGDAFRADAFDDGYAAFIAKNRALGAVVYDAAKQVASFTRWVNHPLHEALVQQLRNSRSVGLAAGGFGIRIDNPNEERFRADWHQEYPAQLRSLDGINFWSPLVNVTQDMGPVQFCRGSHKAGLLPVLTRDPDHPEKTGAYGLVLKDREKIVAGHTVDAPLSRPGDLVILDFLTLHQSGYNRSARARWSMQARFFNFEEATGQRIGWKGSFAAGLDFTKVHPELVADP